MWDTQARKQLRHPNTTPPSAARKLCVHTGTKHRFEWPAVWERLWAGLPCCWTGAMLSTELFSASVQAAWAGRAFGDFVPYTPELPHRLAVNSRARRGVLIPGPKMASRMTAAAWNFLCRQRAVWKRLSHFLHGKGNPPERVASSVQPLIFANTVKEVTTEHYSLWGLWHTRNRMRQHSISWQSELLSDGIYNNSWTKICLGTCHPYFLWEHIKDGNPHQSH